MDLKFWAYLAIGSALLVAGCGGNGDDGGGGGGGGVGTPEATVNTAALNKPGLFQVTYNTGQGRAPGSMSAVLTSFEMTDNFGLIYTLLNPARVLGLDQYSSNNVDLNVSLNQGFSTNLNSRSFDLFNLDINHILIENNAGQLPTRINGPNGNSIIFESFPMRARFMPGRTTSMQIFLNDAMIFDDGNGGVTFDTTEFEDTNFSSEENQLVSHLSDYLQFDITGLSNKPTMTTGPDASYVYFSGDAIALSEEPALGGSPFEVLVPLSPDPGALQGLVSTPPSFPTGAPGTYTLREIDPRSLPTTATITSLQGTWKPWYIPGDTVKSPILTPGNFVFITLPQSLNDNIQDLVMFSLDADKNIDEMYFGEANLQTGSFAAWPIDQVDDGAAENEINGTFSALTYRGGIGTPSVSDIRGGTFTITAGTKPASFPITAKFIVYRL